MGVLKKSILSLRGPRTRSGGRSNLSFDFNTPFKQIASPLKGFAMTKSAFFNRLIMKCRFATLLFAFFFMGCASFSFQGEVAPQESIFPHLEGWNHGESVLSKGYSTCIDCHGDKGDQIPSVNCAKCHGDVYPHSKNWGMTHKSTLTDFGSTASCGEKCHSNLQSCSECHDNYPHSKNWLIEHPNVAHQVAADLNLPLFDIAVGDKGLESCTGRCHNTTHSVSGTCRSCHSQWVHPVDWTLPTVHGKEALDKGLAGCARCHGSNFEGGELAPACSNCHADFPYQHREDWDHGAIYLAR